MLFYKRKEFWKMQTYTTAIVRALFLMRNRPETVKWTEDLIMCKNRGCVCKGCKFDRYPCLLKSRVVALVKLIGSPKDEVEPTFYKEDKKELEYLLKKYSKGTVCEILNISRGKLQRKMKELAINER